MGAFIKNTYFRNKQSWNDCLSKVRKGYIGLYCNDCRNSVDRGDSRPFIMALLINVYLLFIHTYIYYICTVSFM